jgi:cytidylate kinase
MSRTTRGSIIAIDGPSGAGKSTIARLLARELGYLYIDTGAMYRAIGLKALRRNPNLDDRSTIVAIAQTTKLELKDSGSGCEVILDGEDVTEAIRSERVSQAASIVSELSEVRRVLVSAQQQMGAEGKVVLEGRDIGTKVFPNADLKIFLDASERTRAERRFKENLKKGLSCTLTETLSEIHQRDERDSQRADSPLIRARDAIYVDTSGKTIEEVLAEIKQLALELNAKPKSS